MSDVKRKLLILSSTVLGALALHAQSTLPEQPTIAAERDAHSFAYRGRSPEFSFRKVEEGIASDGTNRFLIYRRSILKVDSTWTNVLATNDAPLSGLKGFDHLGAGEYYNGKLY